MIRLFVSYRRSDAKSFAHRLYERLRRIFGRVVFMDVSDIDPGEDFARIIETRLASCRVLVVVIGNTWLRCVDANGQRRLDAPGDYVRLEVATALASDIRVIPVLVNGATIPEEAELPKDLQALAKRNAVQIDDDRFDSDIVRLIETIEPIVPRRSRVPLIAAALTAVLVLAAAGYWLRDRLDPGHGVRLVPSPALYANLPAEVGGRGMRYDLVVRLEGRTAKLLDLTRAIVYTGAERPDLLRLRTRQDAAALSHELERHFESIEEGDAIVAQLLPSALTLPISGSRPGARIRVEVGRYDSSPDAPQAREPWFECEFVLDRGAQTLLLASASKDCHRLAP